MRSRTFHDAHGDGCRVDGARRSPECGECSKRLGRGNRWTAAALLHPIDHRARVDRQASGAPPSTRRLMVLLRRHPFLRLEVGPVAERSRARLRHAVTDLDGQTADTTGGLVGHARSSGGQLCPFRGSRVLVVSGHCCARRPGANETSQVRFSIIEPHTHPVLTDRSQGDDRPGTILHIANSDPSDHGNTYCDRDRAKPLG
jgi:hypothetical protein